VRRGALWTARVLSALGVLFLTFDDQSAAPRDRGADQYFSMPGGTPFVSNNRIALNGRLKTSRPNS
jgi:hypothetical protein